MIVICISDPVAYGTSKSTGRARKLKQRYERNVARAVSNTMKSAKDVGAEIQLKVSKSPIFQTIHISGNIKRQIMKPIRTIVLAPSWLPRRSIKVLDWPACSPDLNLIESVWGILASSVYKTGKQYNSISELKNAVKAEWNKIQPSYFENLSNSMPNRIFQVIQKNGGFTKY
uniref:Transposable element Tc3 transposase-like DNA-binding HTH domain-containing protein n=1 Tax=Caenorhabditis japonica TaxID=281687 RepID=A0A8R1EQV2_CAEJA